MGIWYQFIRYEFICTVGTQVLSTTHGTSYYVTQYKKYVPYIHTYIYTYVQNYCQVCLYLHRYSVCVYEHWYAHTYIGTQVCTVPVENWLFLEQLSQCRTHCPGLRQPTAGPLRSQRSWQQSRAQ